MLSLCPCVRDDRAEVAQRAAELVKNPLPAMSGGADTRKFGDPVEGWLQRVVDGDECEAVWCCLRERHLYYYAKQPKKGAPRKPLGYVEQLHSHNVAHRAVAPEHLWIDARGALKLHELPCAVRLAAADRTNTLCGVPEYVAPEVVLAAGHDHAVDLWALGVLVFELVSRRALFARSGDTPARP